MTDSADTTTCETTMNRGEKISSRITLRTAARNKFKRWTPAVESEIGDPKSAMVRLSKKENYLYPHVNPSFQLSRSESVFTVGSCFARNIERSLINLGLNVASSHLKIDPNLLVGSSGLGHIPKDTRAILNKYSTAAIRSELERAVSGNTSPAFIQIDDDQWVDPHLSLLKPATLEQATETRAEVNRIIQMVHSSGVVMLTLGLTETWFDNETQTYLNGSPPMQLITKMPDRFVFRNMSIFDCIDDLEHIVSHIRQMNKEAKIIMTVSPVPINTTFTAEDAIVANARSKATLRTAIAEVMARHNSIDYFPSYEMVTMSPRELAYGEDQLHVRVPMVDAIMDYFVETYIKPI